MGMAMTIKLRSETKQNNEQTSKKKIDSQI